MVLEHQLGPPVRMLTRWRSNCGLVPLVLAEDTLTGMAAHLLRWARTPAAAQRHESCRPGRRRAKCASFSSPSRSWAKTRWRLVWRPWYSLPIVRSVARVTGRLTREPRPARPEVADSVHGGELGEPGAVVARRSPLSGQDRRNSTLARDDGRTAGSGRPAPRATGWKAPRRARGAGDTPARVIGESAMRRLYALARASRSLPGEDVEPCG